MSEEKIADGGSFGLLPDQDAISVIETDCEVDFAPPLDYVEPQRPDPAVAAAAAAAAAAQRSANGAGSLPTPSGYQSI